MIMLIKSGLLLLLSFYFLPMVYQSRRVVIHQYRFLFEKVLAVILIIAVFTFITYVEPTLINYSLAIVVFAILIFEKLVLGFTETGVIALIEGNYHPKGLLSDEISFEDTKDWLIKEKKHSLKIRFTVDSPHPTLRYLSLPIDKKSKVMEQLDHYNIFPTIINR
ncbi:hypothetical protein ACFP65_05310 [Marinilactibacillus sp. GCM10026970]|uniref:hypothetical protein n=1 Tax=Marinilactibacillus sp. GCM10026970 TaxID=3252642 RepID=UPI00361D6205